MDKVRMKNCIKWLLHGPLEPLAFLMFKIISNIEYMFFERKYSIEGAQKPSQEEIDFVRQNVTFIYKSFKRQKMAERLYKNIQDFYPGAQVIIADDSDCPLDISGDFLKIIHLPFNSGLSYGLNCALEKVDTPYVMRMDDDELLTCKSKIGEQLQFLKQHPEVDFVGFCVLTAVRCQDPTKAVESYIRFSMSYALKPMLIPHMTQIDDTHFVMGKVPNIFLARTDKVRSIGWDDNIRMMDHQDFFYRAAGNIVTVIALGTSIFHYHNPFEKKYQVYRQDVGRDMEYIKRKRLVEQEFRYCSKEPE